MGGTTAAFFGVGRLTRDAELKYTNSGAAICHFCIATDSREKKGDQWVDVPSFWDVDLWGKQGESLTQYLTKGKLVTVSGGLSIQKWEKDGQQHQKVVIKADSITLIPTGQAEKTEKHDNSRPAFDAMNSQLGNQPAQPAFTDDIPF